MCVNENRLGRLVGNGRVPGDFLYKADTLMRILTTDRAAIDFLEGVFVVRSYANVRVCGEQLFAQGEELLRGCG